VIDECFDTIEPLLKTVARPHLYCDSFPDQPIRVGQLLPHFDFKHSQSLKPQRGSVGVTACRVAVTGSSGTC
jgi:hypothetical protein